jgi:hypothetical protein
MTVASWHSRRSVFGGSNAHQPLCTAGTVLPVAAVDPFSAGERASYYARAGVLSRSLGILFNLKAEWRLAGGALQ